MIGSCIKLNVLLNNDYVIINYVIVGQCAVCYLAFLVLPVYQVIVGKLNGLSC